MGPVIPEATAITSPESPGVNAGWVWAHKVDPTSGEYSVFINNGNQIELPIGGTVVSGMRVILSNTFATLPVCGHTYATAQFMGRGSTEVSFQLSGVGNYQLSRLQAMVEECQKNAREFRRIKGAAKVDFSNNPLLALCGITDGIISSVDAKTEEGYTDLYRMSLSFTSEGHHMESWGQENYTSSTCFVEMLEAMLRRVRTIRIGYNEALQRLGGGMVPSSVFAIGQLARENFLDPVTRFVGSHIASAVEDRVNSTAQAFGQLTTSPEGMLEIIGTEGERRINLARDYATGAASERVARAERSGATGETTRGDAWYDVLLGRGGGNPTPIITPVEGNGVGAAKFETNSGGGPSWLADSLIELVRRLHLILPTIPGRTFFLEGPGKGRYYDISNGSQRPQVGTMREVPALFQNSGSIINDMMWGLRLRWPSVRDITDALNEAQSLLMSHAQETFWNNMGQPDFETVFPGMINRVINSRHDSLHPTYPDLDLPAHPKTGSVLDTEPDFYFFNDSEEGMLNEIGPEIIQEMDTRLQNAELSMTRLASGNTWSSTYMGRSRLGPDDNDAWNGSLSVRDEPTLPMDGWPGSPINVDPSTSSEDANQTTKEAARTLSGTGTDAATRGVVDSIIGTSCIARSNGDSTQVQMNRQAMLRKTTLALPAGAAATDITGIGPIDTTVTAGDRTQSFQRNFIRQTIHQGLAQNTEKTLTMRRAFPTFKIYFLEDDIGEREHLLGASSQDRLAGMRTVISFDDFYNYNSVKEIRLVRSRKNPADLLILTLTNVAGLLERRIWGEDATFPTEAYAPGLEETELENPLKKLILKEGLKVQARLGNSNNPDSMGIKFVGEVVELSYNAECTDEVTVICQSFGAELVLEPKGLTADQRFSFTDTPDIVHTMMCSPELAHFGRYSLNLLYNPAEARCTATTTGPDGGRGERESAWGIISDPDSIGNWARSELLLLRSKYVMANNPADDNIYAVPTRDLVGPWAQFWSRTGSWLQFLGEELNSVASGEGSILGHSILDAAASTIRSPHAIIMGQTTANPLAAWLQRIALRQITGWVGGATSWVAQFVSALDFIPSGQTVWEIMKECELRHPGWIAQPRPYGTRMTMFFGIPTWRYWADEIDTEEMMVLQRMRTLWETSGRQPPQRWDTHWNTATPTGFGAIEVGTTANNSPSNPYSVSGRSFWFLYRTWRDMEINRWLGEAGEYVGRVMGRFRPFRRYHILTSDHHIILNNIRASDKGTFNAVNLIYNGGDVYTLKADDSIPEERTTIETFDYSSSVDSEIMARRYAIGLLNRHLKDVYKGEVVVVGMDVDPWDTCYLHDERTGMFGTFDVEQVVDTISAETGWITEITPDLVTGTNEWSTMSTDLARRAACGAIINRISSGDSFSRTVAVRSAETLGIGTGVAAASTPLALGLMVAGGALAWSGGYFITRWTQDRQPIWVCPLILGERPFFAGLDGFRQDGIFASLRGRLVAEIDNVEHGWRAFHLAGYFSDAGILASQRIAGQLT